MRNINKIIIHCTATPEGRDVSIDDVRDWHVNGNRWFDVGYHFLIRLDGTIETGRDISQIGAHCVGHNKYSIAICYVGGMNKKNTKPKDTRTDEQRESLRVLIDKITKKFPDVEILGHRDLNPKKACPSFDVSKEKY